MPMTTDSWSSSTDAPYRVDGSACTRTMWAAKAVRRCVVCGKAFVGNARAKYCPECRVQKHRENYQRHMQRKKEGQAIVRGESMGTCEICGRPFVVMAGGQRYCPDCAKAAYMASDRQKSREWAEREKARRQRADAATGEDV